MGDMAKRVWIYSVFVVVACGLWLYTHSETAKVRRVFDETARLMCKEPTESVMEGAVRAKALGALLSRGGCRFEMREFGQAAKVTGEGFAGSALVFRNEARCVKVEFRDLAVTVGGGVASVGGQVDFSGTDAHVPLAPPLVRAFTAALAKEDGAWRFTECVVR